MVMVVEPFVGRVVHRGRLVALAARALFVAVVGLVALVAVPRHARAMPLQELALKAKPSVVLLTISDAAGKKVSSGTGFFVSTDGRVVTNHHVISGASKVTASLSDGRKVEATGLLLADEKKDLAILKLPGEGYAPLSLGESKNLHPGDEVVVIGSPLGLSTTLSAGIVSALRDSQSKLFDDDDPRAKEAAEMASWGIQITAAISPGSSGSPVLNMTGDVIAVAVGRLIGGESLNFGIPVEEARAMLEKVGPAGVAKPFEENVRSDTKKNLIISAIFFLVIGLTWLGWRLYDAYAAGAAKRSRAQRMRS